MRDPVEDLPVLRAKAGEAVDLAACTQHGAFSPREHKDFAYMAFSFLGKQTEHMRSILALVDAGLYRDAGLIARSMLEGRAQLVWASKDPEERGRQWRDFWPVADWRKMKKEQKAGRTVPPAVGAKIEQGLTDLNDKFLTASGRKRRENGQALRSKDYWDNWTGHSYSELLDLCVSELGGQIRETALRLLVYAPCQRGTTGIYVGLRKWSTKREHMAL
jgi:hypothetical protein